VTPVSLGRSGGSYPRFVYVRTLRTGPGSATSGAARRQRRRVAAVCFPGAGGYAAFVVSPLPTPFGLFVPFSPGTERRLRAR